MPDLFDRINALWRRKENFINTKLSGMEKSVNGLADTLLSQLITDYLGKFDTKDGVLLSNTHNMSLVTQLEKQFEKFSKKAAALNLQYGKDMLKTGTFSKDYYAAFPDVAEETLKSLTSNLGYIDKMIGISGDKIISGSFLDTLSTMPEVQNRLKNFVLSNVAGNNSYASYLKGMGEMIKGTAGSEGILQRYYRQYAYDTFNNVDAAINKHYAQGVGFKYFIYHGSVIDTTRAFCRKRAGKVFSIVETKTWSGDPDLIGKAAGYVPLIERGRYNCRHSIKYISDVLAFQLRPGLKKKK